LELLTKEYITPNELFYTRNHLALPNIDPDEYVLDVKSTKRLRKHKFTLNDLKTKFKNHEVFTTLQGAGNHREDLHQDRKLFLSPHWVVGAMSTAKWGGVKMRDILKECGMDGDALALGEKEYGQQTNLQFLGYDTDETGCCYGSGIPMDKAVDALGDAIFAFEMNDEPLPRDHGFPVRAVVPGHTGNCQCKWLRKVIVSNEELEKPWQRKSYRGFAPAISFEEHLASWLPPRLDQAPIVHTMPVQSFVCNPPQNSLVDMKGGTDIEVKGVAWSGGGNNIERVDASIDGGKNWTAAELYKPIEQQRNRHWAWTQFSKKLQLPEVARKRLANGEQVSVDIVSEAMNYDFNVQPETAMEP
jgi:sulfite oxidase